MNLSFILFISKKHLLALSVDADDCDDDGGDGDCSGGDGGGGWLVFAYAESLTPLSIYYKLCSRLRFRDENTTNDRRIVVNAGDDLGFQTELPNA